MEINSFSRNSLITFLTEIAIFVFGFVSTIIITRILGPTGKGIYSLILLIPGLMISFGSFGIESANIYFVSSKKYKTQDVVSNSLILSFLLGSILILIFWSVSQLNFFQKFIHSNQIPIFYLWLVVSIIPLNLLYNFFRNILWGKGEIINSNKIRIAESAVLLLAVVIFLLILKQGLFGAVFSSIVAVSVATFLTIFLVRKISNFNFFLNKDLLRDSTVYGGKVYLANTLSFLNYRSDMFFLAFFLTPAAVGFYSIAVSISEKLFIISGALAGVLFPRVSSILSSEANDFTSKIARHTFFIMILASLLLFFLARPLIALVFGPNFLPSVIPLILLLPGIIAFGLGGVLAADLAGRGKPEFAVYSSLGCFIIDTILNFILIPRFGVPGAAIASSISYSVDTLIILIAFLKISKRPLKEVLLIKKDDFKDYLQIIFHLKNWVWRGNKG